MSNKIISIKYVECAKLPWVPKNVLQKPTGGIIHRYLEGYEITLDDSTEIVIGIDPEAECSEDPGIIEAQDDIEYFIGSELIDIEVADDNSTMPLNIAQIFAKQFDTTPENILTWPDTVTFVRIITSKGVLPFGVYNDQNGYYGHEIGVHYNFGETCLYQIKSWI